MVSKHLHNTGAMNIAAVAFTLLIIPCFIILYLTGYFSLPLLSMPVIKSTGFSFLLGFGGTAVATVLYYRLVKSAGGLFASTVTYGIPFVALFWGILGGESINPLQCGCMVIILIGVWLTNKK
jgi:drug/metabolite transporter (DMT)-like permease